MKLYSLTKPIDAGRRVRQDNNISPKLFTSCLKYVYTLFDWCNRGKNIHGVRLNHLRFADSIFVVVSAGNIQDLQRMVQALATASLSIGL